MMAKSFIVFKACLIIILIFANQLFADGIIIPPVRIPRLSIKYHKVTVEIDNQVATTKVDQVFVNESNFQIEGTYIFPLPNSVSISKFAMYIGDEKLEAELLDKNRAREIYEEIVRKRQDPAILEYIGTNMFRARVFPIEPRGEKRIQLEYTELLKYDSGLIRYTYPLNTEKFSLKPLNEVSIKVDLRSNIPLKAIYSPSHSIKVIRKGDFLAEVRFSDENVKPDTDFALYYTVSQNDFSLNLLTYRSSDEPGFYLLMLSPKPEVGKNQVIPKNALLVLDTSGSMKGEKIKQAKEALKFSINGLNPGDTFNLIEFNTDVDMFKTAPVLANSENISAALKYIDALEANGGTDINDALLLTLKQKSNQSDRVNMLIFLTDGLPTVGETNVDKILKNVSQANDKKSRIFSFGVGFDVNTHLLDKLSEQNEGVSEYVKPNEDLELKVSSFFSKINSPVLAFPSLDFGGINVRDFYPKKLPDLFAGSQLIQFGRYSEYGYTTLRLKGNVGSKTQELQYGASFPAENRDNEFIPRLWATRKIGFLLDSIRLDGENKEVIDEIVALSKKYGVITSYTSFLILEDELPPPGPIPLPRPIPLPPQPLAQLAATPQFGAEAVKAAVDISKFKAADSVQPQPKMEVEKVKSIGAKTFYLKKDIWTDSEYQEESSTIDIQYGSPQYFELLSASADIGRYLAIGKKLILCLEDKCYRIVDTIKLEPPLWDINQDGDVNIFDLVIVSTKFGILDKAADVNQDGNVDVLDVVLIATHFGESYIYSQTLAAPPLDVSPIRSVKITPKAELNWKAEGGGRMAEFNDLYLRLFIIAKPDETEDIVGLQFDLSFPPKDLELVSVEPGLLKANGEWRMAEFKDTYSNSNSNSDFNSDFNSAFRLPPSAFVYWQPPQVDAELGRAANIALVRLESAKNSKSESNSKVLATAIFKLRQSLALIEAHGRAPLVDNLKVSNLIISDSEAQHIKAEIAPIVLESKTLRPEIQRFEAFQNYPNPFNPETWIPYQLPQDSKVIIRIFDSTGKTIKTLDLGLKKAGLYLDKERAAYWDGRNDKGELVSSGIYFYTIESGEFKITKKMIMMK